VQAALRDYLFPVQLAVSVPNGASLLVFSLRELLDVRRDFCVLTIDFKNAFNVLSRAACMRALTAEGSLTQFARMCYAFLAPKSPIFSGAVTALRPLPFASEEGVQQGSVEGAPFFCLALQPLLVRAEEALAAVGGAARAGADDVNLVGPPALVVQVAEELIAAALAGLGIEANFLKCHCWIAEEHADLLDASRGRFPWGGVTDACGLVHRGITVYGVPMGSAEYIRIVLEGKCARIAGNATKLINMLGRTHKQLLWLITKFSTAHKLDYWLLHCFPGDVAEAARRFDKVVRDLTVVSLGCDPAQDPVATERVRLPERLAGLGLRSAEDVSATAFLAGAVSAVSAFLDAFEEVDGELVLVRRGALERPAVVERIGRDAFAHMDTDPGPEGGWHRFMASGSRLGAEMLALWEELRQRGAAARRAADGERLRVLDIAPHCVWPRTVAGLQADICADIEDHRYEQLLRRVVGEGPACRGRDVLVNATRESVVWVRAFPQGRVVPVQEWVEITSQSLGLNSPVFTALVGLPCGRAGRRHVDPFGDAACAETGVSGDHFARLRHDPLCDELGRIMRAAGVHAVREDAAVFARVPLAYAEVVRQLFARGRRRFPTVDISADLTGVGLGYAEQQGTALGPTLVEMKTVQYCPSRYHARDVVARAAVDRRVAAVSGERRRALAALDREFFGTTEGARGPFEARLDAFPGGVLGVGVGAFGEWSASLVGLVQGLASCAAERWMGRLAAPSLAQARATLLLLWRQQLGMCALRGHARLRLARARQLYSELGGRGGAGGAPWEAQPPVGAGPEVGNSSFARAADGVYWRCPAGRDERPSGRGVRGAYHARAARAQRARA
jgi:hypothetical protein